MTEPTEKGPSIEKFLEETFGRTTAIKSGRCLAPPVGCGKVVTFEVDAPQPGEWDPVDFRENPWKQTWFRDAKSMNEYRISGLCQTCQDTVFPPDGLPDWVEAVDLLANATDMSDEAIAEELIAGGCRDKTAFLAVEAWRREQVEA